MALESSLRLACLGQVVIPRVQFVRSSAVWPDWSQFDWRDDNSSCLVGVRSSRRFPCRSPVRRPTRRVRGCNAGGTVAITDF